MKYEFSYYTEKDFDELEDLILNSYNWDFPNYGLSRFEFCIGLHPKHRGIERLMERGSGIFRLNGKIAGAALNEVNTEGDAFFLFDSKENAQNTELLEHMIFFAQTGMSQVEQNGSTRFVQLRVPDWNTVLEDIVLKHGFIKDGWPERNLVKEYDPENLDTSLPEGYRYADGNETPDFFLSNTHMASFNYSIDRIKEPELAFHNVRKMKSYDPDFDVCIIDPWGRPVAMANLWYKKGMSYCELEPLGVVWWERRKKLGTKLLNEVFRRLHLKYPECTAMLGGDQPFYERIGFEKKGVCYMYKWKVDIYPSWEQRSESLNYRSGM